MVLEVGGVVVVGVGVVEEEGAASRVQAEEVEAGVGAGGEEGGVEA